MVVVLVVMTLLAAAAVFSLQAPLRNARMQRVLASIEDADYRARTAARRLWEPIDLTIDGDEGTATQSTSSGQQPRIEHRRSLPWSGGLQIDQCIGAAESTSDNRFVVRYGPGGQTDTYAIRVSTNRNVRQSRATWLIVVGATGQYIRSNEDSVVEAIVAMHR